jgi:hypothetical protein
MGELFATWFSMIRGRWHSRLALIAAVLVVSLGTLLIVGSIDLARLKPAHWGFVAIGALSTALLWFVTNRVPRSPRGTVGIVVAISTEAQVYARQLRSDFIESLRSLVASHQGPTSFALVAYDQDLARRVQEEAAAEKYLRRSRGRLILFGTARTRQVSGRQQHVIDLKGCVLHKPIPREASKRFGAEMSRILPPRIIFDQENDVFSFQLTSEITNVAARYIMAMAALLSHELDYAEQLFLEVHQLSETDLRRFPTVAVIRQLLPQRLSRLYTLRVAPVLDSYFLRRDTDDLVRAEQVLEKLERWDPMHYGMNVARALCAFALRRDVAAAWRHVKRCVGVPEGTWRYSGAFLHAYAGDLRTARKWYRMAVDTGTMNETVPIQTEEFIYLVLDEEPERYQLHFCAGLINLWAKKDMASARRAFSQFLAACDPNRYREEQQLARNYILEADRYLAGTDHN